MRKKGSLEIMAAKVGNTVKKMAPKSFYTPFMAAASKAISHRLSLVDFVLDVRDARIPLSSECDLLKRLSASPSSRRIIVLNKLDLARHSHVKEWIKHFEQRNFPAFSVNSHNKASIQEFLNFLQGQVRALRKAEPERHTVTMMLVGIPNVGKSALANSLHQIGRISAAEKGKLRHAVVSPLPGETKGIYSLKVASHPSIYVLDAPGILPVQTTEVDVCAKLALTVPPKRQFLCSFRDYQADISCEWTEVIVRSSTRVVFEPQNGEKVKTFELSDITSLTLSA